MLEAFFEKTTTRDVIPIIISSIAIVGFWRGIWGLMDLYLFPNDFLKSHLASAILGLLIILGISFYKFKK